MGFCCAYILRALNNISKTKVSFHVIFMRCLLAKLHLKLYKERVFFLIISEMGKKSLKVYFTLVKAK